VPSNECLKRNYVTSVVGAAQTPESLMMEIKQRLGDGYAAVALTIGCWTLVTWFPDRMMGLPELSLAT